MAKNKGKKMKANNNMPNNQTQRAQDCDMRSDVMDNTREYDVNQVKAAQKGGNNRADNKGGSNRGDMGGSNRAQNKS